MTRGLCLILMFLVPMANARPRWKTVVEVGFVTGVAVGSTIFQTKSASNCRAHNDVSVCFGGYGSPKAMTGLIVGESAGFLALSLGARHWGVKEWALPSLGSSTFNIVSGVKQTQARKPKEVN
jgi:hypothetical protein